MAPFPPLGCPGMDFDLNPAYVMAKKAAKKKAPAKKAQAKKAPAKKAAKKAPAKKAAVKKKAPAKKAPAKKATKKAPAKKAPAKKKAASKKAPAKKAATKKSPAKKAPAAKKAVTAKKATPAPKAVKKDTPAKKKTTAKKAATKKAAKKVAKTKPLLTKKSNTKRRPLLSHLAPAPVAAPAAGDAGGKPKKLTAAFLKKQRQKLLDLRDTLVDQMNGVARDTLGRGEENADSSAFGMHQADAGSDSYDRDFALNLLSQEQNALYEIEEALLRIDSGEYGVCQGSGNPIPVPRLEAMPFARCTVDYQEKLDKEEAEGITRNATTSLFGLDEKEASPTATKEE